MTITIEILKMNKVNAKPKNKDHVFSEETGFWDEMHDRVHRIPLVESSLGAKLFPACTAKLPPRLLCQTMPAAVVKW